MKLKRDIEELDYIPLTEHTEPPIPKPLLQKLRQKLIRDIEAFANSKPPKNPDDEEKIIRF